MLILGYLSPYDFWVKDHNKALKSRGLSMKVADPLYVKMTREAWRDLSPDLLLYHQAKSDKWRHDLNALSSTDLSLTATASARTSTDSATGRGCTDLDIPLASASSSSYSDVWQKFGKDWPLDVNRFIDFMRGQGESGVAARFRRLHGVLGRAVADRDVPWQREAADVGTATHDDVQRLRTRAFDAMVKTIFNGDVKSKDVPYGKYLFQFDLVEEDGSITQSFGYIGAGNQRAGIVPPTLVDRMVCRCRSTRGLSFNLAV